MATSLQDLTDDLVEEILCRVPATYLKQSRYTSKRWNQLFNDMRFARKHFEIAAKQFLVLMLTKDFRIGPPSINLDGENPSAKLKGILNLPDPHYSGQFEIYEVFHCEGLLLCTSKDESRMVVWNPLTGETRWIIVGNLWERGRRFVLGYYQDKKKRNGKSYKVLIFSPCTRKSTIYELNSDSWRILDNVISPGWGLGCSQNVSLKGKAYWFGRDETETRLGEFLVRFDFETEKAKAVPLPYDCFSYATLSLSVVRDEKLSVLLQRNRKSKTEIWVTNKIDESWSKVLSLDIGPCPDIISVFGSFVLDEEKKVVVCCERWIHVEDEVEPMVIVYIVGEDNKVTLVDSVLLLHAQHTYLPTILNYVPSLVQIE